MKRRNLRLGIGAAIVVFALSVEVGVSRASWFDNATVTGSLSVQSGTAGLEVTGIQDLTFTGGSSYVNVLTLTNTGTESLSSFTAQTNAGPTDQTGLAVAIAVTIWLLPPVGTCGSPPAGSPSGSWASWPSSPFDDLTLTPASQSGDSAKYCILSTWDGSTSTLGQIQPTVTISTESDVGTASGVQTTALQATAANTVTPSQVGVQSTDSVDTSVSGVGITQTDYGSTGDTDIAEPGTIVSISNFCTVLHIVGSGEPHAWSVKLDANQPPYYGANLAADAHFNTFGSSSATSGHATHLSGDPSGIYTITGAALWEAGDSDKPFNWVSNADNMVHNTPIAAGQSTSVTFCLDDQNGKLAPVMAAGPTNYAITVAPHIVSCNANGSWPSATYSDTLPIGLYDVCWHLQLTGYYPHFYIGFSYSFNWADLVTATYGSGGQYGPATPAWFNGNQSDLITAVEKLNPTKSVGHFFQHTVPVTGQNTDQGSYEANSNHCGASTTGSGATKTVNASCSGITNYGGITNNMYINAVGQAR